MSVQLHKNSRIAVVCETPYQLINAFRLFSDSFFVNYGATDLYIGRTFRNVDSVYRNFTQNGIFQNVYLYDYKKIKSKYWSRFLEIVFPRFYINKLLNNNNAISDYDYVFLPVYLYFGTALLRINLLAECAFFEDGLASYISRNVSGVFSFSRRLIWFLRGERCSHLKVSMTFLNRPEMYDSTDNSICQRYILPTITDECLVSLISLFNYNSSIVIKRKTILYLSQPSLSEKDRLIKKELLKYLSEKYNNNTILRLHPREYSSENYGLEMENEKNWEMMCLDSITDNHILITPYSTSAFVPKMLSNKEPYIIFVYNLFDVKKKTQDDVTRLVEKLKGIYRNPKKICVVKDIKQFQEIVNHYLS